MSPSESSFSSSLQSVRVPDSSKTYSKQQNIGLKENVSQMSTPTKNNSNTMKNALQKTCIHFDLNSNIDGTIRKLPKSFLRSSARCGCYTDIDRVVCVLKSRESAQQSSDSRWIARIASSVDKDLATSNTWGGARNRASPPVSFTRIKPFQQSETGIGSGFRGSRAHV